MGDWLPILIETTFLNAGHFRKKCGGRFSAPIAVKQRPKRFPDLGGMADTVCGSSGFRGTVLGMAKLSTLGRDVINVRGIQIICHAAECEPQRQSTQSSKMSLRSLRFSAVF
jgi:hypothetical protein